MLNRMCVDCTRLGAGCKGTKIQAWTGCLSRTGKPIDYGYMPIMSRNDLMEKGVLISSAQKEAHNGKTD